MDQLILFHKPNKILDSEMMIGHFIPQSKQPHKCNTGFPIAQPACPKGGPWVLVLIFSILLWREQYILSNEDTFYLEKNWRSSVLLHHCGQRCLQPQNCNFFWKQCGFDAYKFLSYKGCFNLEMTLPCQKINKLIYDTQWIIPSPCHHYHLQYWLSHIVHTRKWKPYIKKSNNIDFCLSCI